MSILQIAGLAEIVAVALIGILLDRYLGNIAAAVGLCICLAFLGWLHWSEIKPLIMRHPVPQSAALTIQNQVLPLSAEPLVAPLLPMPSPNNQAAKKYAAKPFCFGEFVAKEIPGPLYFVMISGTSKPCTLVRVNVAKEPLVIDEAQGVYANLIFSKFIPIIYPAPNTNYSDFAISPTEKTLPQAYRIEIASQEGTFLETLDLEEKEQYIDLVTVPDFKALLKHSTGPLDHFGGWKVFPN